MWPVVGRTVGLDQVRQSHQWQQLDQGQAYCLNCGQSSIDITSLFCEKTSDNSANSDNLWREADRLARQMEGLSKRLFEFRDRIKPSKVKIDLGSAQDWHNLK